MAELAKDEQKSQQAKRKSQWSTLDKVWGAKPHIACAAANLVQHFQERNIAPDGKAQLLDDIGIDQNLKAAPKQYTAQGPGQAFGGCAPSAGRAA